MGWFDCRLVSKKFVSDTTGQSSTHVQEEPMNEHDIALLLSILSPSLTKVKLQDRRTMCRSNLHQWALGVLSYAAANDDKLLCTFGYTIDGKIDFVVPNEFWLDATNYTADSYYDHPGRNGFL